MLIMSTVMDLSLLGRKSRDPEIPGGSSKSGWDSAKWSPRYVCIKIAKLVSADSKTGPITVQSVVRLSILENAQNFVGLVKSPEGERFLDRWLAQLSKDAVRERVVKSEVVYLDQGTDSREASQHVAA